MVKRGSIKIEILPLAKKDLVEIYDFIAKESLKYAKIEKLLIIKAISRLYTFPNTGTPFNYKSINARQMVFRNYLIIYRYKTENLLEILTIHHHSRSFPKNPAFNPED
jgi:toxin ParE1/3/4